MAAYVGKLPDGLEDGIVQRMLRVRAVVCCAAATPCHRTVT